MGRRSIRQNTYPWPSPEFLELKPPKFEPFVFIRTASYMPSSIAMAGAVGGSVKYISLAPNTGSEDLPVVQKIVRERYSESRGVPLWGEITGFFFVYSESEGILLDLDGNEVEGGRRTGRFWPQSISIETQIAE